MTDSALAASLASLLQSPAPDRTALARLLREHHPVDIAEAAASLEPVALWTVIDVLEGSKPAALLHELDAKALKAVLEVAPTDRAAELLAGARSNDAVRLIDQAPDARQMDLLDAITARSPEQGARLKSMLAYRPGSAGRLMTRRFLRLPENDTVGQAFKAIRRVELEVETLSDLYIVDDEAPDRLLGVVSLRELTSAKQTERLADIMTRNVISVSVDAKEDDVARLISKYDFMALPVLAEDGTLAGVVMVDDVLDILVARSRDDQLRFGAVEPGVLDKPYFATPIRRVVRSRISWLVLLFVAETFTGSVLRLFEGELSRVVALSFFIPLLIGTGGNTGAQTVSTIIRGLALSEIKNRDVARVLMRELWCGLLLGLGLGIIAFVRSRLWGSDFSLSLVVGLAILIICTWANTIGSLIPMIAQRFKIDPALVSAPLITTLVDATGLAIYLSIAKLLLPALH